MLLATAALLPAPDTKPLPGWSSASPNWVLEDRTIALINRSDAREHNDSYLWTDKEYGDFVLDLEYKVPAGNANSGVFIRTSDKNDPVYTGIEIQVANLPADGHLTRRHVGGLYDLVAPRMAAHKAGEWNRCVITAKGSRIRVELNGQLTAEADLDQWTETGKNPDGSPNKFKRPIKEFARRGYIGLQDHGLPVWYRNIRIKPL